jgi:2-C-methyl-D-erythritol 2,4-cyclodiphosphate synthase
MQIRIGFGYDVHCLEEGQKLIIGGVNIIYHKGTVAHSDGDVLVHSICDALLGAAGLRDIGFYFPDNDKSFKNISSLFLLEKTIKLLNENGYVVGNIDSTVCLQRPKIQDYIPEMKKILAETIKTDISNISIKATTSENLGFVGSGDGITSYSVALIEKVQSILPQ